MVLDSRKDEQHHDEPSPQAWAQLSRPTDSPAARGPGCPSPGDWGLFEAGLMEENKAISMVQHASECDACGALLSDMKAEESAADFNLPLRSSTPVWKQEMALRLANSSRPAVVKRFPVQPWWIAVAAALLLVAGTSLWFWKRVNSPEEAFRLLARSYSAERPFDLRIPGSSPGPIRSERGWSRRETVELREAEALIERKLRDTPESGPWLQARARAEILESDYRAAIQDLLRAQEAASGDPGILGDLGIAYLQAGAAEDLPRALDAFGHAITARPADPVLRFNRAIAFHRMHMPKSAIEEWKAFLALENTGAWADEARSLLADDEELVRRQAKAVHDTRSGVSEAEPGEPPVFEALARWTPPDHPTIRSLRTPELADLGKKFITQYGDWWLNDMMDAIEGQSDARDLISLELAEEGGRRGDPSSERTHAQESLRRFRATGNVAGVLRAEYELLYSFQRSSMPADCLRIGNTLSKSLALRKYPWLTAQAWLEQAACSRMTGDFASALNFASRAERLSMSEGLGSQYLRSISIHAAALAGQGRWLDAWESDLAGLNRFWHGSFPPARAYQFYYTMGTAAEQHGYFFTAAALQEEAVAQIALTGNRTVEAMARMRLANLDIQRRDLSSARAQTTEAIQLFNGLKEGPEKMLYLGDGEIGLARVESEDANPATAARHLESAHVHLVNVTNDDAAVRFFRTKAIISRQQGNVPDTEMALNALAHLANAGLRSLRSEDERQTWIHDLDDAYRGLTRLKLLRGDTDGALEIWESYRTAHAVPGATHDGLSIGELERSGLPFTAERAGSLTHRFSRSVALVYVQMDDGVAAWRLSGQGAAYHWIPGSRHTLERLAARYLRDCADPSSRKESILRQGRQIYDTLVAPVLDKAPDDVETIVFDADGPLALIPFEALQLPDGSSLGDRKSIVVTPGISEFREDVPVLSTVAGLALIVAPSIPATALAHLTPLPDASREASEIASYFPVHSLIDDDRATVETLSRELPSAVVFHFAGHALTEAGQTGLVLNGSDGIGIWNSASLRNLDLHKCRLAVLSACATSTMDGWGVADPGNLARAFLSAGVSHVVASRWPVNSDVTRHLMAAFYESLRKGNPVARALRDARTNIRQTAATNHPYYWAAFSTFGNS
jgi:CHAT domain-containing protein